MRTIPPGKTADEVLHLWETQDREAAERLRAMLRQEGREDLVQDFDRQRREGDLGITSARATWEALTEPQRRALRGAGKCQHLHRKEEDTSRFYPVWSLFWDPMDLHGIATLRHLCRRGLLHPNGPALDVEAEFVITEHGRFVLRVADV